MREQENFSEPGPGRGNREEFLREEWEDWNSVDLRERRRNSWEQLGSLGEPDRPVEHVIFVGCC